MNPAHGWSHYQARMGRVTAYIHDHLDAPLDLNQLAELAHMSPFHWHRVYHALAGETIAATIRRARLSRASGHLANGTLSVTEVAQRCGYPNVQSFSRAFREAYGASPAHYREQGKHTIFREGVAAPLKAGYEVTVDFVPAVQLAGVEHRGSYMNIGKAFETAFGQISAQGLMRSDTRWMAVYRDDPASVPECQLSACAGLTLPADRLGAVPPLQSFELGGSHCAVLTHQGPYATMAAAYQWLYGQWLPTSGLEPMDRPVFEEYLNNPRNTAPLDLLTRIFLPIQAP